MKILVTGAKGFVGKNLCSQLKNIMDGKARWYNLPEAIDKACFFISGIDENGLLQTVDTAVEMNAKGDCGTPVPDYTDENVSIKVVKIIQSYVGIVNKMVWRKS